MRALALALCLVASAAAAQAINERVTQSTIHSTICKRGWSESVRPPYEWSHEQKLRLMRERGIPASEIGAWTLDHVQAIENGGAPANPRNLQLQRKAAAQTKDLDESRIHWNICNGRSTLAEGQAEMLRLWPPR